MTATSSTETLDQLTGSYQLDLAHTRLGFAARHPFMMKVHGWFDSVEGQLRLDAEDRTSSSATLTIEATSIRTGNRDRDDNLRSAAFFDVERYPTITFESTQVTALGNDCYRIAGDLTIKAIARPIEFELTHHGSCVDPYGRTRVGLEGSGSLKGSDWGLTWTLPLRAGGLLSDRIDLLLDVSAVKVD